MNSVRSLVFALALSLSWVAPARAGTFLASSNLWQDLIIRSWGTEAGLPQNTVNAIVQTRDGYLWLGTREGLARFDGVRFTSFGLQEGLPTVDVSALCEDRQGTLWLGTIGGGLCRKVSGRIEKVPIPNHPLAADIITALVEDADGRLWIGTGGGLYVWENGQFVENDAVTTLTRRPVTAIELGHDQNLWISAQGIFEYKTNVLNRIATPTNLVISSPYCLLEDQQRRLWAGVGNGLILCRQDGQWRVYRGTHGVPFAYLTCLAEESDGTIWAGSLDDGLYCFAGGHFYPIKREHGLSADDIRALKADREGHLWVGTRTGGLNRLSRRTLMHFGREQGLTNDFTRSVAEAADGTLYVGTIGGGLYQGNLQGFKPIDDPISRYYAQAESVLEARDGSLWWGGLHALLHRKDGRWLGCYTNEPWARFGSVTALCENGEGGLWIGNSQGRLVRFQNERFSAFEQRVARGPITALAQETNGFLWVGSVAGGLKRLRWGNNEVQSVTNGLRSQTIRTLYLDGQGSLWIGTAGGGLSRRRNGHIATFTAEQGLNAKTVSQIVEDDFGFLWLGCNRGILRVRKRELEELALGAIAFVHPRSYGVNDGMPAEECSSGFCPAGLKTRSGLVCFSTVRGLVFIDPSRQETNSPPPAVLLEEALVNGRIQPTVPIAADRTDPDIIDQPPATRMVIPPGGREVEFRYTGISFSAPEKVSFRYQLEGLDREWVEAGGRRAAYYHRIPAGKFVFRVIACNADGIWNEEGAALEVISQPYLWETAWFLAGVGLAGVFLFAAIVRFMERRRFKQRLVLLQTQHAVEKERLRISQDMHDHIGGMLTQVTLVSDVGQSQAVSNSPSRAQFERIGAQARGAVQALDEIVWATNPKNDNLPRFAEYVSRFADEFFEGTPIRCWQEIPAQLPKGVLTAEIRHDVFLAVKEVFNNVLKHSGAKEVWLRLGLDNTRVTLEIEDHGRGFDPARRASGGNGLENIKTRLAECGGQAELTSVPGQGTKIRFVFPMQAPRADGTI